MVRLLFRRKSNRNEDILASGVDSNSRLYPPSSRVRISDHPSINTNEISSIFREDMDRVLRSFSFRRLAQKTQLYPVGQNDYVRTRLTHSLEVASLARTIATTINNTHDDFRKDPINTDLVETAALCHDLGHPPFGHTGEDELNICMQHFGGFEGNAQSLRLIVSLEHNGLWRSNQNNKTCNGQELPGLNLSIRAVASVIKYDHEINILGKRNKKEKQKGYYPEEKSVVHELRNYSCSEEKVNVSFPTIECQIMDIADDIVYCISDLDDALKMNYLDPLSAISADDSIYEAVSTEIHNKTGHRLNIVDIKNLVIGIFKNALSDLNQNHRIGTLDTTISAFRSSKQLSENSYHRAKFCRELLNEWARSVDVKFNADCPALSKILYPEELKVTLEAVKSFVYNFIINSPEIQTIQHKNRLIVRSLFESLMSYKLVNVVPYQVRSRIESASSDQQRARVICDYISAMTDSYASELIQRQRALGGDTIYKPIY